jgi:ATP-binding cassette subfamily B protein
MNTQAIRFNAWHKIYQQLLRSAGERAPALRASLIGLLAAATTQGLAMGCLFPLFEALLHSEWVGALGWLVVMTLLSSLTTVLRWQAQGFEYNGQLAATTHELRTRLGQQLRRMPLERLEDRRAGEMNALLLGNVDETLNYTLVIVNLILLATVTPLVTALAAMMVDWRLGMIMLLIFPAILPLYRWRRPTIGQEMREVAQAHQRTGADIVEYCQGLPVLRSTCCANEKAATLQSALKHLEAVQTQAHRQGAKPDVLITSVCELGLQLMVATSVTWVVMGTLDVALLAAVMVIVARFTEPMATFITFTKGLELIEAALERIKALFAVAPLPQSEFAVMPEFFEVRFENVSFRYANATEMAIEDLSTTLSTRGMAALVGSSGSGKSTLVRLLMRHADPQLGRITIGGVDIRQIPTEKLNTLISVVFQDVYLFDDSVLANVRMARPDATDDEVREALHAAQCSEFVQRLPQGWHTRLGDIGERLSGGERQRLSIARALLKEAPIVILDEPTAALDTESEVAVQRAIDALVWNKTVLVIAHRLSTIAGADQILVLENGRIVEQGRHVDLLAADGRYRDLWEAQQAVKVW